MHDMSDLEQLSKCIYLWFLHFSTEEARLRVPVPEPLQLGHPLHPHLLVYHEVVQVPGGVGGAPGGVGGVAGGELGPHGHHGAADGLVLSTRDQVRDRCHLKNVQYQPNISHLANV